MKPSYKIFCFQNKDTPNGTNTPLISLILAEWPPKVWKPCTAYREVWSSELFTAVIVQGVVFWPSGLWDDSLVRGYRSFGVGVCKTCTQVARKMCSDAYTGHGRWERECGMAQQENSPCHNQRVEANTGLHGVTVPEPYIIVTEEIICTPYMTLSSSP
jgi:hypothetical protein